uniref:Uncharacterized protein n=1 Tax=Mus spicilegus TaxID=10103 RepID=A0A8C6G7E3_MUSSI
MMEQMTLYGILKDHNSWIAQMDTTPQLPDMILFMSQNKAIITGKPSRDKTKYPGPDLGERWGLDPWENQEAQLKASQRAGKREGALDSRLGGG